MRSDQLTMRLLQGQDDDGWEAYHAIRRRVLWELRGRFDYDDTHPDELREGHFPLLFSIGATPVGTVRLDVTQGETAVGTMRLVAVLPQYQRQGVGTAMINELKKFAAAKGVRQMDVHAARDAVAFYRKLGWQLVDANRESPFLTKIIS